MKCGVAKDFGIEPIVRHDAELELIPVIVMDSGDAAAERSSAKIEFIETQRSESGEFIEVIGRA